MIEFDGGLARESSEYEWQGFSVFPGECPNPSPNPNFTFLVKKATLESEKTNSFRIMLPPAMPPPRDSVVPLPMLPHEAIGIKKKHPHQKQILLMRKSRSSEKIIYKEEDFKCNTFCFSLLGFGKHKPVRSSSFKRRDSMEKKMMKASSFTYSTVSIRASLEKFECGSWTSITALTHDTGRLFFDSPVEMMKFHGGRDVQEPVSSRFLFDRGTETLALKSILKTKSSLSSRRYHWRSPGTSPHRRVRFSTLSSSESVSCPASPRSCIA